MTNRIAHNMDISLFDNITYPQYRNRNKVIDTALPPAVSHNNMMDKYNSKNGNGNNLR